MKKKLSIPFLLLLVVLSSRAFSQFPLANYYKKSSSLVNAKEPQIEIKLVQEIKSINDFENVLKQLKTLKPWIDSLQIKGLEDAKKINPVYAHHIGKYLDGLDSNIQIVTTNVLNLPISTPEAALRTNNILVYLADYRDHIKDIGRDYHGINRIMGRPRLRALWFPVRREKDAMLVYNASDSTVFTFGNSFTLLGSPDEAAVNSEITSGYIGPVRIALNTLISTSKDTSTLKQSQLRLISGGGNTALSVSFAVYRYARRNFDFFVHLAPKFIAEIPMFGAEALDRDKFIGSIQVAPDFFFRVNTNDNNMSFFANVRMQKVYGTDQYLKNLGLNNNFEFGQINLGIFLIKNLQLSATMPLFASRSSLMKSPILFTTQFFPKGK